MVCGQVPCTPVLPDLSTCVPRREQVESETGRSQSGDGTLEEPAGFCKVMGVLVGGEQRGVG